MASLSWLSGRQKYSTRGMRRSAKVTTKVKIDAEAAQGKNIELLAAQIVIKNVLYTFPCTGVPKKHFKLKSTN